MSLSDRYLQEYTTGINKLLEAYISRIKLYDPLIWRMGKYVVGVKMLKKYLEGRYGWKRYYVAECKKNIPDREIWERLKEWLEYYKVPCDYRGGSCLWEDFKEHLWYNALSEYQGWDMLYVANEKQLRRIVEVTKQMTKPVILLSEFEIPEDTKLVDTTVVIGVEFTGEGRLGNVFLEYNFPLLFHYFNLFDLLTGILQPVEVYVAKEEEFRKEIWKEICRVNEVSLKSI